MNEVWWGLTGSPGWRALVDLYRHDLEDLRGQLLALALESSDPKVRAVAWRISATEAILRRPEEERDKPEAAEE